MLRTQIKKRGGLDVLEGTVLAGEAGYSFQLVHQDTSVYLTTTPSMVVFNGQLIIIFGATRPFKNAFYSVNYTAGGTWPTATDANLGGSTNEISSGVKPGLAVLNAGSESQTLWMTSQQNNQYHYLYVYYSTDGIHWAPNTAVGTGGKSPTYAIGGGISMVTIDDELVLANQQDASPYGLIVLSSPDGTNWSIRNYPTSGEDLYLGNAPALALFNDDVALQYRSNTSAYMEANLVIQ
jgi:hypothetical protein